MTMIERANMNVLVVADGDILSSCCQCCNGQVVESSVLEVMVVRLMAFGTRDLASRASWHEVFRRIAGQTVVKTEILTDINNAIDAS